MLDDKDMTVTLPAVAPRDDDGNLRADYVEEVVKALDAGNATALRELVGELHEADAGAVIEALDPELRPRLIALMGADFDFTALTQVDDTIRDEILEELPPETVAEGVRELDSDDAVTILEDLPQEDQAEILDQLPAVERIALRRSLDYPEDSAGRRMQDEFIAVGPDWTVGQTIDYMRETADLPERFWEIYVVDADRRLTGVVALDRLLRTKRPVPIKDLFEEDLHSVDATDEQEEVARLFERYDLVSAPVVDKDDRLVGVITFDDIVDVIEEEAEADIKALGGVSDEEELSDSVWTIAKSRFPWLFANLLTALVSAWVISNFENAIAEDGGARRADADRGLDGRQCRHPDHDGDGARARDPRIVERQHRAGSSGASCWSACSTAWCSRPSWARSRRSGSASPTSASSSRSPW